MSSSELRGPKRGAKSRRDYNQSGNRIVVRMALAGLNTGTGLFKSTRQVVEAVQTLSTVFWEYRQCVKDHQAEKEKYKGMLDVWAEEIMRAAEEQGIDPDGEEEILVENETEQRAVDTAEVVMDVVLQHKQALLDEWRAADNMWKHMGGDMCDLSDPRRSSSKAPLERLCSVSRRSKVGVFRNRGRGVRWVVGKQGRRGRRQMHWLWLALEQLLVRN